MARPVAVHIVRHSVGLWCGRGWAVQAMRGHAWRGVGGRHCNFRVNDFDFTRELKSTFSTFELNRLLGLRLIQSTQAGAVYGFCQVYPRYLDKYFKFYGCGSCS